MKAKGEIQEVIGRVRGLVLMSSCLLPSALCLSCASLPELPWAPPARDASAGFYKSARIEYRLDAGQLGQAIDPAEDRHRVGLGVDGELAAPSREVNQANNARPGPGPLVQATG